MAFIFKVEKPGKICLSRFSFLATLNPYTNYILKSFVLKRAIYTSAIS